MAARIFTAAPNGDVLMNDDDPPAPVFLRNLNVVFDDGTQEVPMYGETEVAANQASFLCPSADLAGVTKRMRFDMPALEEHEDGYGKSYEITSRIVREGPQCSRVYLKEL